MIIVELITNKLVNFFPAFAKQLLFFQIFIVLQEKLGISLPYHIHVCKIAHEISLLDLICFGYVNNPYCIHASWFPRSIFIACIT